MMAGKTGRKTRRRRPSSRWERVERLVRSVPARVGARIDLMRPKLALGYGAMNGQEGRQAAVTRMFQLVAFDLVIETGTYRGTTTEFLRGLTQAPIVTIEVVDRLAYYARACLRQLPDVRVVLGDSATEIRRTIFRKDQDAHRPFCYLDAHWHTRLPLRWEVLEVMSGFEQFCIVIDDFQVPDDPGYRFDDYGPGFRLSADLFDGLDLHDVTRFSPSIPSKQETGHRRGWLVLARGDEIVDALRSIPQIREIPPISET